MGERASTKGPWCLDGHNLSSVLHLVVPKGDPAARHLTGDYEVIARCEGDNWAANARLISAAPDMFEAIEEAHSQAVMLLLAVVEGDPSSELQLRVNDLLEVLAKASASASASSGRNLADAHKNPLPGEIAP